MSRGECKSDGGAASSRFPILITVRVHRQVC
jgi:hypothetical protein